MDLRGRITAPPTVVEGAGVNRFGRPLGSRDIAAISQSGATTAANIASEKLSSAPIKTSHHQPSQSICEPSTETIAGELATAHICATEPCGLWHG